MVRVVSWNMDHWRRRGARQQTAAWEYLESLNPDYALLQETVPPPGLPADRRVHRKEGIEGRGKWGSAVVSFAGPIRELVDAQSPYSKKAKRVSLHRTLAGSLAVAEVGKGVVLVSAYGTFEEGYTVTTVHKLLSDLTPLLDSRSTKGVVLAGDLNVSTQWLGPHRPRHRNALERVATLGLFDCLGHQIGLQRPPRTRLKDCPCENERCLHVRTQRHPNSTVPWQTDYVFVSKSLVPRVRACFVKDSGEPDPWQFSDHCPIVLELAD